jgi:hypothetical protein
VDESGQPHFSDTAPADIEAESKDIRPAPRGERTELRPGERAMLRQYERRGKRLKEGKRRSLRQYQRKQYSPDEDRKRQAKCKYYQQRLHAYRAKRRRGYTRAEEGNIAAAIQRYEMQTGIYCD